MKYVYAYNSKEVELLDGTVLTISKQRKTEVCKLFRDQAIPRQKAKYIGNLSGRGELIC